VRGYRSCAPIESGSNRRSAAPSPSSQRILEILGGPNVRISHYLRLDRSNASCHTQRILLCNASLHNAVVPNFRGPEQSRVRRITYPAPMNFHRAFFRGCLRLFWHFCKHLKRMRQCVKSLRDRQRRFLNRDIGHFILSITELGSGSIDDGAASNRKI
jgi:hypothetical protein